MADSTSNSLTIEELAGQQRKIVLTGSGMPHVGAEWSSMLSVKTRWYPGNGDEATQQVLGPQDPPSKWEGTWRRTMLSRSPAVVTAGQAFNVVDPHLLVDSVEAVQRAGARLRVTWQATTPDGGAFSRVREGRLVKFTHKWDRVTDVHWEAEFEWVGRGTQTQKVVATRDGSASDAKDALQAELTNFTGVLQTTNPSIFNSKPSIPGSSIFDTLGQLEALALAPLALVTSISRKIEQEVSALKELGDMASNIANEPFAIAEAVSNLATNTSAVMNSFYDELSSQPVEQQVLKDDVSTISLAANTFGKSIEAQRRLARRANEIGQQAQAARSRAMGRPSVGRQASSALDGTGLLAIHVTRKGDTPESLSRRYYRKNPDHYVDIMRANHLPWTQVTFDPGTTLIIPRLTGKQGV